MPHLTQSFRLDLTDALAGHSELPTDLLERAAVSVDQPEPLLEDLTLALSESFEDVLDLFLEQHNRCHVARILRALVLDKIAKVRLFAFADRRLERDRLLRHFQNRANAIDR